MKNEFLLKNKFCQFCIQPNCATYNCGSSHLLRTSSGDKRHYVCQFENCKRRLELCVEHYATNKEALNKLKVSMKNKYNIDANINAFIDITEIYPLNSQINLIEDSNSPPLLLPSTTDLLQINDSSLLADKANSIFIFSKIRGLTRPITAIFDSAGGSSLCLDNVVGHQLFAAPKGNGKVCLSGIGRGKTFGEAYNVLLPLAEGGNVAAEIFSVKEILRPMAKINLSTALSYFKNECLGNKGIHQSTQEEIERAKIYHFIEGSVDLLVGIKLMAVFPTLVHSLPCGLSIFKMKLKSADPGVNYCLGGPYRFANNLQKQFPNASIMLQQIELSLKGWRAMSPCEMQITPSGALNAPSTDNSQRETLCHEVLTFSDEDEYNSKDFWHSAFIDAIERFIEHMTQHHSAKSSCDRFDPEASHIRKKLGSVYRHYFVKFEILQDIMLVKGAIMHLDNCECVNNRDTERRSFNTFISLEISKSMKEELNGFKRYFDVFYKNLRNSFIDVNSAHITMLALHLPSAAHLYTAGRALTEGVNKWINLPEIAQITKPITCSFQGIDCFNENTLVMKVHENCNALQQLHDTLFSTFTKYGFDCDDQFTPHLTFARLSSPTFVTQILKSQFKNFTFGSSSFHQLSLRPFKRKSLTNDTIYKTIPLSLDATFLNLFNIPISDEEAESPSPSDGVQSELDSYVTIFEEFCVENRECSDELIAHIEPKDENNDKITPDDIRLVYPPDTVPQLSLKGISYHKMMKDLYNILYPYEKAPRCSKCVSCTECNSLSMKNNTQLSPAEQAEDLQIKESIFFDESINRYYAPLPLKADPTEALSQNLQHARRKYLQVTAKLTCDEKKAVIESFEKLRKLNIITKLSDFPPSIKDDILNKQLYVIPWQLVKKCTSVTTPNRIVLNASSKTTSGKSLNDILCKGVNSLSILPLAITMIRDPFLLTVDITKFYNSCLIPVEQYNLQCLLWQEDLNPEIEPELFIIRTHMYGVVSSGRILELCLKDIAEKNKKDIKIYDLFCHKLYVDDMFHNSVSTSEIDYMKQKLHERLTPKGFNIKGFSVSYSDPPNSISIIENDVKYVNVIGMLWSPKQDTLKYRVKLCFDQKNPYSPKELEDLAKFSLKDLDSALPTCLTLRVVSSICASIWDPTGWLAPWFLGVKHLLRQTAESVSRQWDDTLSLEIRKQWINVFYDILKLTRIYFPRCSYPKNTIYHEVTLVAFSDYGKVGKMQIFYLLRPTTNNGFHVTLIQAKSQLSGTNSVPCQELDSLYNSAVTLAKIAGSFECKVNTILVTDSSVVCFWITKNPIKLGAYQRKRVCGILENFKAEQIYHIRSECNIADTGTKNQISIDSCFPNSTFHEGPPFLSLGIEKCVSSGILKPLNEVIVDPRLRPIALSGILLKGHRQHELESTKPVESNNQSNQDLISDILVCTHFTSKVMQRFVFHDYIINPLCKPWRTTIKIMSLVLLFIHKLMSKRLSHGKYILVQNSKKSNIHKAFKNIFYTSRFYSSPPLSILATTPQLQQRAFQKGPTYINCFDTVEELKQMQVAAFNYFMTMASKELGAFYKPSVLSKHTVKAHDLFFSKQRYLECNEVENVMDINVNPISLGINQHIPCADRFSPVGIALLMHYHRTVSIHAGADRTYISSLESVFIFQGQQLARDICRTCFLCRRKLQQKCKSIYGPINKHSLVFTPVNMHVMLDMSGPYLMKSNSKAKATRANNNMQKVWVLHTVCLTTFINTIVIVEDYSSAAFIDALHRVGCRYGYPAVVYTDASQAQIKALTTAQVSLMTLIGTVFQETGINIKVSGTGASSHSRQGRVEKSIDLFKRYLYRKQIQIKGLSLLQFDTVLSTAQSYLNSLPLCTKSRQKGSVSSLLVTPFTFLLGRRGNVRAPVDIPSLPDRSDMLNAVKAVSDGMYKFYANRVQDLLLRPKNYDNATPLNINDLVIFPYKESEFDVQYKLGLIINKEVDADTQARIYEVAYANSDEISLPTNKSDKTAIQTKCRTTRKGVESLIKIYSADDKDLNTDIDYINKYVSDSTNQDNSGEVHEVSYGTSQVGKDITPELLNLQLSYLMNA